MPDSLILLKAGLLALLLPYPSIIPAPSAQLRIRLPPELIYLPSAVILAHTLDLHGSKYPLLIQHTSSLGRDAIAALTEEADNYGRIQLQYAELLLPRKDQENKGSVADCFKDTFTKLRAFQVYTLGYTRAVFLDADMAVFQNPDEIFDIELPGRNWLAANHSCVCNLDQDS